MQRSIAILALALSVQALAAQVRTSPPDVRTHSDSPLPAPPQRAKLREILKIVELGIRRGAVDDFSGEWNSVVTIAMGSSDRQYYSMNQATSMLNNFFAAHRPISFKFSRIDDRSSSPYATGRLVYIRKGVQESVQIYISFSRVDARWVITQFNIY